MTRIAVIIPDRRDRPRFLEQCLKLLAAQTLQPVLVVLVDDEPLSNAVDITWRYRIGYQRVSFSSRPVDLVAFIENDDWYHPNYLEYMAAQWEAHGRPAMLGLNHTVYYHIGVRKHFMLNHPTRSNAMNTFILPGLPLRWPLDHDPYTDVWLWNYGLDNANNKRRVVLTPAQEYCLGIKHGVGKCGGQNHSDNMERYVHDDEDGAWLRSIIVGDGVDWYLASSRTCQ